MCFLCGSCGCGLFFLVIFIIRGAVLYYRRKVLERYHHLLVAVDFDFGAGDDFVIWDLGTVEGEVLVRHLLQGVGEVEGEVLLLGVEHERELVALFDQFHELRVLLLLGLGSAHRFGEEVLIGALQFIVEDLQGFSDVPFGEYRSSRKDSSGNDGRQYHRPQYV